MTSDSKNLAKKTAKNALWNYSTFATSKGVMFVTTVILARILLPEDFGLLALGLIAINYLDVLNDFGLGAAVVYRQAEPRRTANTAFVLSMATGLMMTLLAWSIAPFLADFFREPRVTAILRVLSLNFLLASAGSVHEAVLKRDLNFRRLFMPQMARMLAKGIVSIGLALSGYGVWSLVIGQLAGTLTSTVLYWFISDWKLRPEFDFGIARQLLGYGVQLIFVGLFGTIHRNIDYLLVGRRMDSAQLGYYTLAYRLPELVILNMVTVLGQAIFPTYAKLQNDLPALRAGFLTMLRIVAIFTIPCGIGMFMVAPEFITVFYTDRWAAAIPVMQMLALYTAVLALSYNAGDIYKATGRPGILNKIAVVKLAITIPVLWWAANHSILHVAVGQLFTATIISVLSLWLAGRILQVSLLSMFDAMRPAAISALVMLAGTLVLRSQIDDLSPLLRLILMTVTGGGLYAAALWFTAKDTLMQAVSIIKPARRAKPAPVAETPESALAIHEK